MKNKYSYLVAYTEKNSIGTINITSDKKIKTFADIMAVKKYIEEKYGYENVAIYNFIRLKRDKELKH